MKVEMFIPGWSWLQGRFPSPILGPNTRENPRFKCGDARETDCKNALKFGLADYDQVNPHQLAPVSHRHVESTIFHWFFLEVHTSLNSQKTGPEIWQLSMHQKAEPAWPGCMYVVFFSCPECLLLFFVHDVAGKSFCFFSAQQVELAILQRWINTQSGRFCSRTNKIHLQWELQGSSKVVVAPIS